MLQKNLILYYIYFYVKEIRKERKYFTLYYLVTDIFLFILLFSFFLLFLFFR